ncbi:hypothetical protein SBDP2_960003 [Syntrophobacter sp. SbD2]|nr:hypothetical protein SBDP2_960003 [Syntrophobacter sp. SbD2]
MWPCEVLGNGMAPIAAEGSYYTKLRESSQMKEKFGSHFDRPSLGAEVVRDDLAGISEQQPAGLHPKTAESFGPRLNFPPY